MYSSYNFSIRWWDDPSYPLAYHHILKRGREGIKVCKVQWWVQVTVVSVCSTGYLMDYRWGIYNHLATMLRGLCTWGGHLLYFYSAVSVHWVQNCTLNRFNIHQITTLVTYTSQKYTPIHWLITPPPPRINWTIFYWALSKVKSLDHLNSTFSKSYLNVIQMLNLKKKNGQEV